MVQVELLFSSRFSDWTDIVCHAFASNVASTNANLHDYTKNRNYNNLSGAVKGLTFPERESGTAKILLFCFEFIGPPRDFDDYRRVAGEVRTLRQY